MKRTVLLLLTILFLFCSSCLNKKPSNLTDYSRLGFPDTKIIWKPNDYDKALVVLNDLKLRNNKTLPKRNNDKSSIYFDKLVSKDNLSFLHDNSINIQQKVINIQAFAVNYGKLMLLYYDTSTITQYYNSELVQIYIYGLQIFQDFIIYSDSMLKSADTMNEQIRSGLEMEKSGYKDMLTGLLIEYEKTNVYTYEDLLKLNKALITTIERNWEWMDIGSKIIIKNRLIDLSNNHKNEEIKKELKIVLTKIDKM